MKENLIKTEMNVNNEKISVMRIGNEEYISLTDLAKYANPTDPSGVIRNWMSNKNSFEFYSLWEELNNENFNSVESHRIKIEEVGYNRFTMTPSRWKKDFNAIGIIPSSGKYSAGTFAHSDIALEFASWLSPEFKLYLIKEFERLKRNEAMFYWLYPKETNRHMKRPSGEKISMFLLKKKSGEREKTDIVDIRNDIWIFLWRKNACTGSVAGRQISLIMW